MEKFETFKLIVFFLTLGAGIWTVMASRRYSRLKSNPRFNKPAFVIVNTAIVFATLLFCFVSFIAKANSNAVVAMVIVGYLVGIVIGFGIHEQNWNALKKKMRKPKNLGIMILGILGLTALATNNPGPLLSIGFLIIALMYVKKIFKL